MMTDAPILVTGAGGGVGSVGRRVVTLLRERELPVRAMVHRYGDHADAQADALRALGAQVIAGDLTKPDDLARALDGVGQMVSLMSVSPSYLQATATVAMVARASPAIEVLLNMSQMSVSQMTVANAEDFSQQQRQHWLSEQVLNWSALPVVHIRPTIFLENPLFTTLAARSIADTGTIRLAFGNGRTSPVAAEDVARVAATVLQDPPGHVGRIYELTGPRSQDMNGVAEEFSRALGARVQYVDVPPDARSEELAGAGLDPHVREHLATLARLHRQNRFDRLTRTVEEVTGTPAQSVEEFVALHGDLFPSPSQRKYGFSRAPGCQLRGCVAAKQVDQLGEEGVEFAADVDDLGVVVAGKQQAGLVDGETIARARAELDAANYDCEAAGGQRERMASFAGRVHVPGNALEEIAARLLRRATSMGSST